MTLQETVAEPMRMYRSDLPDPDAAAVELLQEVGLPANLVGRRPKALSGGQRQRAGIARAIAVQPDFLVLDEPTSSLDLSVRAQILLLLQRIQKQVGLTYLFISHDLGVIRRVADRVAVMYLGEIVEVAPVEEAIHSPMHPYTAGLLAAIPSHEPRPAGLQSLVGEAVEPPEQGCPLHPRCPHAMDVCRTLKPRLRPFGPDRAVACFLHHPPDDSEVAGAGD
jgi:oligopeptide/dipeptide ABC transporter ATP-binding protein